VPVGQPWAGEEQAFHDRVGSPRLKARVQMVDDDGAAVEFAAGESSAVALIGSKVTAPTAFKQSIAD